MEKQKILIELRPSTKEWVEFRANENCRATKREIEQIVEDARKKDH